MGRSSTSTSSLPGASQPQQVTIVSSETWTGPAANAALAARTNHDTITLRLHIHYEAGYPLALCMSSYRHDLPGTTCLNREDAVTEAMGSSASNPALSQARLAKILLPFFRIGNSSTYKVVDGDAYGPIAASVFASLKFGDTTRLRLKEVVKSDGLVEHHITGFQLDDSSPRPDQGPCQFGVVVLHTLKVEYPHLYPKLSEEDEEDLEAALESEDIGEILDSEEEIAFVYGTYEKKYPPQDKMQVRREKVFKLEADARDTTQQTHEAVEATSAAAVAEQPVEEQEEASVNIEQAEVPQHRAPTSSSTEQVASSQESDGKEKSQTGAAPVGDASRPTKNKRSASDADFEDNRAIKRKREHEQMATPAPDGENDIGFNTLNELEAQLGLADKTSADPAAVETVNSKKRERVEPGSDDIERRAVAKKVKLHNNNAQTKAVSDKALYVQPTARAGEKQADSSGSKQEERLEKSPETKRPDQASNLSNSSSASRSLSGAGSIASAASAGRITPESSIEDGELILENPAGDVSKPGATAPVANKMSGKSTSKIPVPRKPPSKPYYTTKSIQGDTGKIAGSKATASNATTSDFTPPATAAPKKSSGKRQAAESKLAAQQATHTTSRKRAGKNDVAIPTDTAVRRACEPMGRGFSQLNIPQLQAWLESKNLSSKMQSRKKGELEDRIKAWMNEQINTEKRIKNGAATAARVHDPYIQGIYHMDGRPKCLSGEKKKRRRS